jgi:hypothetical protein
MSAPRAPQADLAELHRAVGALLWKDPERVLETVARLRGTGAVLECTLRGASMGAAIPKGARLRIELGRGAPYRVGEVVAFVRDPGICVHRVACLGQGARVKDHLVTQGDACFYPDEPVAARRVLGRVTQYRAGEGWKPVAGPSPSERSQSALGRALLRAVSLLMETSVPLARGAARLLRLRKESAAPVEA